jgi:eukaryotic-like serine/threonine-protein kinase
MVRRSRGEGTPDSEVIAQNPDLMPDLARELSLLSMLERARHSASGRSRAGNGYGGPIEPLGEDAFAGFKVVREVRRGGQGVVYEAVQASTGRRVAIKMMRDGLFAGDRDAERFEREVRILGQLEHPGIVGIIASGIRGGHFYYAMDFVEGHPLDQYAQSIARRPRDVMRVMEKVGDAVSAAHLRGIIHRDLKPANILVDGEGQPRILDFGLARIVSEGDRRMTATGAFVGSMPWASPEQAGGDPSRIDLRTDVYSLGVILYQALTGRFPYDVDAGPREALENIVRATPARPRSISLSIDEGAEAITLKCLCKEPERRYQSAGELAADIRRYLSGRPVLAHPPSFWYQAKSIVRRNRALVAGAAAVLAALVLGLIGTSTGLVQASAARRSAVRERDEAQRHAYAASIAAADSALRVDDSGTAKAQLRSAPPELRGWEWKYLAARADLSRQTVALPPVWDAKATPDGQSLLVIDRTLRVSLTDLDGAHERWSATLPAGFGQNSDHHFVIGYSRDGRLAATQHLVHVVVWNLADGTQVQRVDVGGTWGYVTASFSPDGATLLTSGRVANLQAWDLASGAKLAERTLRAAHSPGADFSPDGTAIAASSPEGIEILDPRTLETRRKIPSAERPRPDWGYVRYSPDGKRVLACMGASIASIDPEGRSAPIEFRGGSQVLLPFAFSADGTRLCAGSWDCAVRVWDAQTGELKTTLVGHEERVMGATFAEDRIVSTGGDGTVKVWDSTPASGIVPGFSRHDILGMQNLALGYSVKKFGLVDLRTGLSRDLESPPIGYIFALGMSPDGTRLVTTDSKSRLLAWEVPSLAPLWHSDSTRGYGLSSCFSVDGSQVATIHLDGFLEFRDAATGAMLRELEIPRSSNCVIAYHPDRPELTLGGYWGSFVVVDTRTLDKRVVDYPVEFGGPHVLGVAYSPDGRLLASCDTAGGVLVWDTERWAPVARLRGTRPTAWISAFSPDGERLAVGSLDRMIHIFETRHWREMLILRGHTGAVTSLAWTSDGQRLVSSSSNDGTLRIWDAWPATWNTADRPPGKARP